MTVTFREIVAQLIEWLQQDKRVSYRALKIQFDLDDEHLEVLKDELIDVQQVAVDQDGKMLVWTGEASTPPSSSPRSQPMQQPLTQEDQSTQAAFPPIEPPAPDAERRQLTVMFCDLADSTPLSSQLDPEDLRNVMRAYQETSASVIQQYEGYIAQYLGDGLLVYFGWPQAHEDDAQRAIHAALGIVDAISTLNARLEADYGVHVAVRLGIHTGPGRSGRDGQWRPP
jgi:class 3 adenylate cyclase